MGLLLGLDAVRFLLLVDPPQASPRAQGGLMGGLRHYLPQPWARQEQGQDGSSNTAEQQGLAIPIPVRLPFPAGFPLLQTPAMDDHAQNVFTRLSATE